MNDNPDWNESYYFNFHDEKKDITAFMRIGSKPNKNERTMFFFLMGKELVAGMRFSGPCDGDKLSSAGLKFKETNEGKWKITYNGPIFDPANPKDPSMAEMDILWSPINEPMDYKRCVDEKKTEMSSKVASEHYEQYGHAKGTISVDGIRFDIDAYGERDKSEGVREWGSPKMWMWINSVYDGKYGFNITKLSTDAGDVDAGYFNDGNGNDPLTNAEIDVKMSDSGIPSGFTMNLGGSKTYMIKGTVLRHAALPMAGSKTMMLVETISKTEWNGKTGYGIAEFLVPAKQP